MNELEELMHPSPFTKLLSEHRWEMPNIDYKIVIPAERQPLLDWVKEKHLQTLDRAMREDETIEVAEAASL